MKRRLKNSKNLRIATYAILAILLIPLIVGAVFAAPAALSPKGIGTMAALGTTLTFLDLAKANSRDVVGDLIEENANEAPELAVFDSEDLVTPGELSYETLHRTALPSVSFANAGEGFTPSNSELKTVLHQCFRFGGRIECAKHIADNWRRGGAPGYQAHESSGVMKAAMLHIGQQLFYGTSFDGKGFPGMKAFTPFGGTYTYNAGGTTYNTGSSVYFVKFGEQYARLMVGRARNGNGIFDLPDFDLGDMEDANGKKMRAYISELSSYCGLQIASPFSILRITNLTADSGKGLTDAVINAAKQLMPANWRPDYAFMAKRSRTQLQNSRTVTLYGTGSTRPNQGAIAPVPTTDADGVPIIATDSIAVTDAIEAIEA